jgi:hypothetical protein
MKEDEDEFDEDDESEVLEHLLIELAKQKENGNKAALPTILEKEELLQKLLMEQTAPLDGHCTMRCREGGGAFL